jgi:hypothetical protein
MTLDTSNPFTVQYRLVDLGASGNVAGGYDTGGTDLGHVLSHAAVGFARDMENLVKQTSGTNWVGSSYGGENILLEVVLGQRSSAVLKIGSRTHWKSGNSGLLVADHVIPLGHDVVRNGYCTRLLVRPVKFGVNPKALIIDKTLPALLIPKAFCVKVGPRQYNEQGKFFEATVLTIAGYWDASAGLNRYEGDVSTFPVIEDEEV